MRDPDVVCALRIENEPMAVVQSSKSYPTATNISFDMQQHPITVNSGFFTVCTNSTTPQTMHCMHPPSDNKGTGYDEPMRMVLKYGKGRIFHTTLGHDIIAMSGVGILANVARQGR